MKDKPQPFSNDTEKLVLGTIMGRRGSLDDVRETISAECFYVDFHKKMFEVILELDKKGARYDAAAVMDSLRGRIPDEELWKVAEIGINNCFDLQQHVASLFDLNIKRRFYLIGQYLLSKMNTTEDVMDVALQAEEDLRALFDNNSFGIATLGDALHEVNEVIKRNLSGTGGTGTLTGFKEIDRLGGLHKSDLIVIAADSSNGKTSLSLSFSLNAARSGSRVIIYSMEMRKWQIAARMLSAQSSVNSKEIMYAPLDASQLQKVDASFSQLPSDNIYFDERNTSSIDIIISSIRTAKKRFGVAGAIVDYLQILNANMKGTSKEQFMGDVARRLKNLAVELDIWIIALSQINRGREDKADPAPTLSRIRDSGQINEAADVVMLLYRPEYYGPDKRYPYPYASVSTRNTAMIDIAKGRNIGNSKFIVGFNKETTDFYDLDNLPCGQDKKEETQPF